MRAASLVGAARLPWAAAVRKHALLVRRCLPATYRRSSVPHIPQALERLYQEAEVAKSAVDMAARRFTGLPCTLCRRLCTALSAMPMLRGRARTAEAARSS